MAVSLMFLQLTDAGGGTIGGDAEDADYSGQIELENFRWGLEEAAVGKAITRKDGTSEVPMRVVPGQLEFVKGPDSSTTRLLKAIASGEIMRGAEFTLTERSMLEPFHLVIKLTEVRLTDYELDVSDEEASLTMEETWTLTYKTIKFTYDYEGKHEVELERPPGADESDTKSPSSQENKALGEMTDRFKKMSTTEQARFLKGAGYKG